jgi:hypothetical protein
MITGGSAKEDDDAAPPTASVSMAPGTNFALDDNSSHVSVSSILIPNTESMTVVAPLSSSAPHFSPRNAARIAPSPRSSVDAAPMKLE